MLTQYRYFAAVVDHGGITAASEALGVSQPTISKSLKQLEFLVGVQLFDRSTRQLTAAGEVFLPRARLLLAEQRSLLDDVATLARRGSDTVYINGSPMTALALLTRAVCRIAQAQPSIRISIRGDNGANYSWKHAALVKGEIDVALSIIDPASSARGIVHLPLFEPTLRVVTASGGTIDRDTADLAGLRDRRWIMPPLRSSPRSVIENEFQLQGIDSPADTIEISDWRIALDLVRRNDWVTAVPYHPACFEDEFEQFNVLPIAFDTKPLAMGVLVRPLAMRRPATAAFVAAVREVVRDSEARSTHENLLSMNSRQ